MTRVSHQALVITSFLLLLLGPGFSGRAGAAPSGQASSASQQDKLKSCNSLADKKGLKAEDRKNFMQDCMNKVSNAQPLSEASQKDKMNACKNLADKRNLKGEDRRSFIKDCMNKVNSK